MSFFGRIISNLGFLNQKSPDGRLRISPQISLGDYKQFLNDAGGQFNTVEIGTGTMTYEGDAVGGTALQTAASGDAVIRQTYQWHNYFAGKPQKIELTASKFDAQSNVTKRFGYFSSNTSSPYNSSLDGLFWENDGTTIRCKIYRNGTEIFNKAQADWDNVPSGFDPADFNFYVIDFLYLGGAVANFWILGNGDEGLVKVASYQHINVDQNTFVKSPNQPVRYEIRQSGTGFGVFNHICADVATEGQAELVGVTSTINTNGAPLTSMNQNTRYAVIGARLKQASRNVIIDLTNFSVLSTTNDDLLVEIIFGGTTGGTITWQSSPFSNVETMTHSNVSGSVIHTGGVKIASLYVQSNASRNSVIETARRLGSFIDGSTEEVFLCATSLTSNGRCHASGDWIEFI